jgi:hypothetical protein
LHFVQHILETLDFMYSGLKHPIVHRDLHESNMVLHFTPDEVLPDLHVIDFGRAIEVRADAASTIAAITEQAGSCCGVAGCQGACLFWDVHALMRAIRTEMLPLTFPPDKRASEMLTNDAARTRYLLRAAKEEKTSIGHKRRRTAVSPLPRMYQLLHSLNAQFIRNLVASIKQPGVPLRFPDLKPAIAEVRAAAARERRSVERGPQHAAFRDAVLKPARQKALSLATAQPRLSYSVRSLIMHGRKVLGPWYMAAVDVDEDGAVLRVREVLPGPPLGIKKHQAAARGGADGRGKRRTRVKRATGRKATGSKAAGEEALGRKAAATAGRKATSGERQRKPVLRLFIMTTQRTTRGKWTGVGFC